MAGPRFQGPGRFVPGTPPRIAPPRPPAPAPAPPVIVSPPVREPSPPRSGPPVVSPPAREPRAPGGSASPGASPTPRAPAPGASPPPRETGAFAVEPEIPREPPAGLVAGAEVAWLVGAIQAHGALRARSFYDTGHLIARLLERRAVTGAANIKELCSKHPLGISHMTANKYLQIARTFDRDTALRQGIEKCYALVVYAKAIGREGEAARILDADEILRGTRLRVRAASASDVYRATSALKKQLRDSKEPTAEQARAAETAAATQTLFRTLGVKRADAKVVRRGGAREIALFIPLDVAASLERTLPKAFARFGVKLAKQRPEWFEPLRAAGWKVRAAPS